jgi:hypothetical protein
MPKRDDTACGSLRFQAKCNALGLKTLSVRRDDSLRGLSLLNFPTPENGALSRQMTRMALDCSPGVDFVKVSAASTI